MLTITIVVAPDATQTVVRERLRQACADGALTVGRITQVAGTTWRAEIEPVDQRIVVGAASYVEVLHRVARTSSVVDATFATQQLAAAS